MELRVRNREFDTHPCVFHHGGGDSICRYGLEFRHRFFDIIGERGRSFRFSKNGRLSGLRVYRRPAPTLPLRPIPNLSIVACTNFRVPGSAELSLAHFGVSLDVLRLEGPWQHVRRLRLLRDYLDTVDTDYVLSLDSHDTFVSSDIHGIVGAFQKLGCGALFQAEACDWPEAPQLRGFYDGIAPEGNPFRYLCAGLYMGEVSLVKRILDRAMETPPLFEGDDQGIYKQVFREFHPDARLDSCCELFQTLTDYKHQRHPERFQGVDLDLEILYRPDGEVSSSPAGRWLDLVRHAGPHLIDRWSAARRQRRSG